MSTHLLDHYTVQGKLDYNQCLDLGIEDGKALAHNFGRIKMLIDVYFPDARAAYDETIKCRDDLNKVAIAHKHAYECGQTDGQGFPERFLETQYAIETNGDRLKETVLQIVRALP